MQSSKTCSTGTRGEGQELWVCKRQEKWSDLKELKYWGDETWNHERCKAKVIKYSHKQRRKKHSISGQKN